MDINVFDHRKVSLKALNPMSRNALYGDGFFTTGVINHGQIEYLDYHVQRINQSIEVLAFSEINTKQLVNALNKITSEIKCAMFRLDAYRVQVERGYGISNCSRTQWNLMIFERPVIIEKECELIVAKAPISVNPVLAGIKHLNRLDNVLAASEISQKNQEAIMLDYRDQVICGSRSNLFLKIAGQWKTPVLTEAGIIGITYQRVLKIMERHEINCHHEVINKHDLENVESAFVTNSLLGVWPAAIINGRKIELNDSIAIKHLMEQDDAI